MYNMEQKINQRLKRYFQEPEASKHEQLVQKKDSSRLEQFYLLLLMKKLSSKEQLLVFLNNEKKEQRLAEGCLLDAIWALSLFYDGQPQAKNLNELIVQVCKQGIITKSTLMFRLSDKTLSECNLVEQQSHDKRTTRVMTRQKYEQNKFNLFREANEGYSKISMLLLSLRDSDDFQKIKQNLLCLVGNFDLDPDRTIDLVLQGFIQNPSVRQYLKVLSLFERSSIAPLVCRRLSRLSQESEKLTTYESVEYFLNENWIRFGGQSWVATWKLTKVVALMVKSQLLHLQEITSPLSPSDSFFQTDIIRRRDVGKAKHNESFVVSMEEPSEKQKKDNDKAEKTEFWGQHLHSTKLWLMCQLLAVNDWGNFQKMWYLYGQHLDLITHQPTLRNIFILLDWSIDKVHQKISLSKLFKKRQQEKPDLYDKNTATHQIKQYEEANSQFMDQLEQIMGVIKSYIGFSSKVYIKICRIFKKILSQDDQILKQRVRVLMKQYLLPGISCQRCNPSMQIQLFPLFTVGSFQLRYDAYLNNMSNLMLATPYFCNTFSKKKKEQNIIFNTLSAEKKKQYLKRVAKLTNNHPFCIFYWASRRIMIEGQKDSIPEIVNVLMNCTMLAMDVFIFVVLYRIVENREPMCNTEHGNIAGWYRNCIIFFGMFYRKHPQTDLEPIMNYVLGQLSRSIKDIEDNSELQSIELKFLKEIITKMSGIAIPEDIAKNQLAIGPKLLAEMQNLSSDARPTKKSKGQLEKYFYVKTINYQHDRSLAFSLIVLLSTKRSENILNSCIADVKLMAEIYDEYTTSYVQLVKMLTTLATDHEQFSKILPENSLKQMIIGYKIPIELAFQVYRNSLKNAGSMSGEEWARVLKEVTSVIEQTMSDGNNLIVRPYIPNNQLRGNLDNYREKFKKCLTYELYCSFWLLNLDCVFYPHKIYEEKIEELKKKIASWRNNDKNQKELERTKTLYDKIVKESESQNKKFQEAMSQANKHKILVERINDKKGEKGDQFIGTFSQILTQMCILPRLLLEPKEAFYCAKFILMFIRVNQLNSNRSVKLIQFIIEYVISYLPFATHKESVCLSVFLSQMLNIFQNWSDPEKLKNDFLTKLGTDESLIRDNYPKMKDFLLSKMFDRIIMYIKTVKDEPYLIKNSLYLLDKLEVIPACKQQADELEAYLEELKIFKQKDMESVIKRTLDMLSRKKSQLPDRPVLDDKKKDKGGAKQTTGQPSQPSQPTQPPQQPTQQQPTASKSPNPNPSKSPSNGQPPPTYQNNEKPDKYSQKPLPSNKEAPKDTLKDKTQPKDVEKGQITASSIVTNEVVPPPVMTVRDAHKKKTLENIQSNISQQTQSVPTVVARHQSKISDLQQGQRSDGEIPNVKDGKKDVKTKETTKETMKEIPKDIAKEVAKEVAKEPTKQPIKQTIKEPLKEATIEATKQPSKEPSKQLIQKETTEPTKNSTQKEPIKNQKQHVLQRIKEKTSIKPENQPSAPQPNQPKAPSPLQTKQRDRKDDRRPDKDDRDRKNFDRDDRKGYYDRDSRDNRDNHKRSRSRNRNRR